MNWYFSNYASGNIESNPQSTEDIPQKMGTTPIPDGYVRLYHQTPLENAESIRTHGILHDKMKGIEGPRRTYVWRTPFYGKSQSHATVELHVPEELFDPPQFLKISDVPPKYIVAIHEPWHDRARYLISNFPTVDSMIESFGENWQEHISTIDEEHMKAIQAYIRHLNIGNSPDKGLKKEASLPTSQQEWPVRCPKCYKMWRINQNTPGWIEARDKQMKGRTADIICNECMRARKPVSSHLEKLRKSLGDDSLKLSDLDGVPESELEILHKLVSKKKVKASISANPTTFSKPDPSDPIDLRLRTSPWGGTRWRAKLPGTNDNTTCWDEKDPNPKGSPMNDDYNDVIKQEKINGPTPAWNKRRMRKRRRK